MSSSVRLDPESQAPLDQLLQILPGGFNAVPDISVRIYRPVGATGALPGIYYIHGGGMVLARAPTPGPPGGLLRRPRVDG